MSSSPHPLAGKPATATRLIDVERLVAAYHEVRPDPAVRREPEDPTVIRGEIVD